ncbi:MAG: alpha/beta hydrolase [Methylophilaceae bacterium]
MITINLQKKPKALVIWLHGLGADANDFVPFLNNLDLKDIEFILPNAPIRPITMNNGSLMRGWYDIESFSFKYQDNEGLNESKIFIENLIKERCDGLTSKFKIFLGGFSQGAALSLYTGLSSNLKIDGIIALSGYLPKIINYENFDEIPIIAIHGDGDDIININVAKKSYVEILKSTSFSFKSYNMAHEVIFDEVEDIKNFLIENI